MQKIRKPRRKTGYNMEIEKKYLIKEIPIELDNYHYVDMEQAYISVSPVIRVRKADDRFILTVKSKGLLAREEFELDISESEYKNLLKKAEGNIISKRRYIIPLNDTEGTTGDRTVDKDLKIELDVFNAPYYGLIYAEVEFPTESAAKTFRPPSWFKKEVTYDPTYHNSNLSRMYKSDIDNFMNDLLI